jgi:hypothetical protein
MTETGKLIKNRDLFLTVLEVGKTKYWVILWQKGERKKNTHEKVKREGKVQTHLSIRNSLLQHP